jgi:uncharacterized protein YegL
MEQIVPEKTPEAAPDTAKHVALPGDCGGDTRRAKKAPAVIYVRNMSFSAGAALLASLPSGNVSPARSASLLFTHYLILFQCLDILILFLSGFKTVLLQQRTSDSNKSILLNTLSKGQHKMNIKHVYGKTLFLLIISLFLFSCVEKEPAPDPDADPCQGTSFYQIHNLGASSMLETDVSKDQVNMLFQILDKNNKGVVGLNHVSLYELLDYNDDMTQSAEANVQIDSFGAIPITVYTVLLLDLSKSVEGMVPQIKQAAMTFINTSLSQQKIAIYTFDGDAPKMRIDFTSNRTQLAAAINNLPETALGTSTNLYEATILAESRLPQEKYTTDEIVQGNIMLFTDGKEEASPQNKQLAINAVQNRTVFVAALQSNSLDETTLQQLASTGNYFKAGSIDDLEGRFRQIQEDISLLSRSVYWLYYQSPRKGNNQWNIQLRFKKNCNTGSNNSARGTYSSNGF